tara:strand:+ start:171 stop:896 length:726 start_codon:yes stop_codon:yes gene_type:complete
MNYTFPESVNSFIQQVTTQPVVNQHDEALFNFILNGSQLPYLVLNKTFDAARVKLELKAVEDNNLFVRYYQKYDSTNTKDWYASALYGVSATNPWNAHSQVTDSHKQSAEYDWTETAHNMPYFMSVLEEVLGLDNISRSLIFKLDPGGYVEPHRDIPLEEGHKIMQVSFHAQWPKGATWYLEGAEDGVFPTDEGTIAMHSSIAKHTIINDSNEPRYFIWAFNKHTTKFKQLVISSYLAQYA